MIDLENCNVVDYRMEDKGVFLTGSCTETNGYISSVHSDKSSILSLSKLHGELRYLRIKASRKGDNVSKVPSVSIFRSGGLGDVQHGNAKPGVFVFGSNVREKSSSDRSSSLIDDDMKDPDVFIFGSSVHKSTCPSKSSSFGTFDSSFSKLSEKMEKLDLYSSARVVHVGTTSTNVSESSSKDAQFTQTSSHHNEGGFPMELKNKNSRSSGNGEEGNESGVFLFGNDVIEKANLDKSSSLSFDERKDPVVFIFGSSLSTSANKNSSFGAFDSVFSKLPEKMEKLNLQNSVNRVHVDTTSSVLSSSKNAQVSQTSSGIDEGGFSKFLGELKNQDLRISGNEQHGNAKHDVFVSHSEQHGNAKHDVFVSHSDVREKTNSGKSSFLTFDESSTYKLPVEIGKMKLNNLDNDINSQNGKSGVTCNQHNNNSAFISSDFMPHYGKEDYCSRATSFPARNSCRTNAESTLSPSVPSFQTSGSNFYFTSLHTVSDEPATEFRCQKQHNSMLTKKNIFREPHKNVTFGMMKENSKNSRLKKKSLKSRQAVHMYAGITKQVAHESEGLEENLGNEQYRNAKHGVFVFGSNVREKTNSGEFSSLILDENSTYKLHDEIGKMKLSSSDNEIDTQKSKAESICNQYNNSSASISSEFTSQYGKEDYCSRPAPLQARNSYGLNIDNTSSPSVPSFQSSRSDFYFTSMHTISDTPRMEFRRQKDTSMLTKENIFIESHKHMTFGMKKDVSKGSSLKKKRGKARQSIPMQGGIAEQLVHGNKGLEENVEQDSTGGNSPMDFSPYQETLVSNQYSREASIASDETINFNLRCLSNETPISGSVNEKEGELCSGSGDGQYRELFSAGEHFSANESLLKNEASDFGLCLNFTSECSWMNEKFPGPVKENIASKDEISLHGILKNSSSMESKSFSYDSSINQTACKDSSGFTFTSNRDAAAQSNFPFAPSSFVQGSSSASRRIYQRKSRVKDGQFRHPNTKVPLASFPLNSFLFPNVYVPTGCKEDGKDNDDGEIVTKVNEANAAQESAAIAAASVKAEEACEKWRISGNQAYAEGDLSKAEDYYSHGVDSFLLKDVPKICSRALMLCYSNRAATRMSLGRLREALSDCKMAITIDPSFLRARVRAGNIFLSLGETADAMQHFEKVLQLNEAKSDQKILIDAVDGLENAQKLNALMDQSSIFLTKRTLDDATKALDLISEGLSFGPHSEFLLEMKAEALLQLRNFEQAIRICEQTLESAEKNTLVTDPDCHLKDDKSCVRLWRWRIISKAYFYLGKLEEANELLKKHEKVKPIIDKYWSKDPESSASFSVTVCELLRLKAAGNEAFQAGKHLEAVDLYTAALALNTESRPYTAICLCNRAAAYQALGQVIDAIADCSLAIALDSSYRKAISRRATLHEIIRDYEQASMDLQKLTSLLDMSSDDKFTASGTLSRSSSNTSDLNQVRLRLCTIEDDARKGGTLDLYMILGVERSCSTADVRKAYRKAALRHHPDKAGQFLARSENCDDAVWREVAEEVHTNADRLFKMIGEAYTILVDPFKRSQYDLELESTKKSCGAYSPRTPASAHSSQFGQSANPRQWQHTYGSTHRRWSERARRPTADFSM